MKLIILFILASCSMSYQYKTKNIKSKFKSYIKQSQKSAKNIEKDLNYQLKVIKEISSYEISTESVIELKKHNKLCVEAFESIKDQDKKLSDKYYAIDLKGKYIDSVKHKNKYNKIEEMKDYTEIHNKLMKSKISEYKMYRGKFFGVLKENKYSVVKTKSVKAQFLNYDKKFKKNYKSVKKKVTNFSNQIKKRTHKNKKQIMAKLSNMKALMNKILINKNAVAMEVNTFDKEFGHYSEIIHGPNSPTYNALSRVELLTVTLNKIAEKFNNEAQDLQHLLK